MSAKSDLDALKFDVEPRKLLVTSEPFVVFTARGYQAAVSVMERKSRREYLLYIGAISLAQKLRQLQTENGDKLLGLEFWLRKEGPEKKSKYILEE